MQETLYINAPTQFDTKLTACHREIRRRYLLRLHSSTNWDICTLRDIFRSNLDKSSERNWAFLTNDIDADQWFRVEPFLEHSKVAIISIKTKSKSSFEETAKRIQNSRVNISWFYHAVPNVFIFRFKNKHCIFLSEYWKVYI